MLFSPVAQGRAEAQRQVLTLRSGTVIPIKLNARLSSKDSQEGDTFTATVVNRDANDSTLPVGSKVEGVVRSVEPKDGKKPGKLDISFDRVSLPNGRSYAISGSPISLDNKSVTSRNGRLVAKPGHNGPNREAYVGIGAGAGLLVNVLAGRKGTLTDMLVGGALGFGAGSLIKGGSSSRDVELKSGSKLGVRLTRNVTVYR